MQLKFNQLGQIKQLAKDTLWYGLSTIVGRFLNFLLAFIHVRVLASAADYGVVTTLYATASLLNIFYTYGMETSFFRFANQPGKAKATFQTAAFSLLISTVLLTALLWWQAPNLAALMHIPDSAERYVYWFLAILALDTLSVIPFAQLRLAQRPKRYAGLKLLNIFVTIGVQLFFLVACPYWAASHPGFDAWGLYRPEAAVAYVFAGNLAASAVTFLLLLPHWKGFSWRLDGALWKEMISYSLPLVIVGLGGMVNETMDRMMLPALHAGGELAGQTDNGIYGANYKLSILITLFIQAFRMGAEPFFFKQSSQANAPQLYARVMKWFVITCCIVGLGLLLFLDIWKHFIVSNRHPEYAQGLVIVPLLVYANIFLGVYYNLSIWYKLTNQNSKGAIITLIGVVITLAINIWGIPKFSYLACAWATFLCYFTMMVLSYRWGQVHYRIPYAVPKLSAYVIITALLWAIQQGLTYLWPTIYVYYGFGIVACIAYAWLIFTIERKELAAFPVIGKWFRAA